MKTIEDCKKEVAQKYNLGNTLVTGHMAKYWEEMAELYAEQFKHSGNVPVMGSADVDQGHGICREKNCRSYATTDYNGHEYWVCDRHYRKLNDEFDEEYR